MSISCDAYCFWITTSRKSGFLVPALAVLALTLNTVTARSSPIPIISDTFSRIGPLVGSNTDTGQAWNGFGNFQTDGSGVIVDSNNAPKIAGLTLSPNTTYNLSIDLDVVDGGNGWIAFGFAPSGPTNAFVASPAKMLHRENPNIRLFNSGFLQSIATTEPFPKRLSVLLTTGPTLANSTVSFKENGIPIGGFAATDASTVDAVFIQANGGRGRVDNLTLTIVPEPSGACVALLGLCSTAAWGMRVRLG